MGMLLGLIRVPFDGTVRAELEEVVEDHLEKRTRWQVTIRDGAQQFSAQVQIIHRPDSSRQLLSIVGSYFFMVRARREAGQGAEVRKHPAPQILS